MANALIFIYAESLLDALQDADALIIVAEWKAFMSPDFDVVKSRLKSAIIFRPDRHMRFPSYSEYKPRK